MASQRLSPKQRAMHVAVAKDVLKLMHSFEEVEKGAFLEFHDPKFKAAPEYGANSTPYCGDAVRLQKAIPKIAKHCTVCAKGAMVLAHIHLYDGMAYLPSNQETDTVAWEYFGLQANLIESAFEMSEMCTNQTAEKCIIFGRQYEDDPRARLRAIMRNVIVNGGRFVPTDLKNKGPKPRS